MAMMMIVPVGGIGAKFATTVLGPSIVIGEVMLAPLALVKPAQLQPLLGVTERATVCWGLASYQAWPEGVMAPLQPPVPVTLVVSRYWVLKVAVIPTEF